MAREPSVTEWAVLALVAEAPAHGFALARELGRDGAVGGVWTIPRPLVYRALESLEAGGLVTGARTEAGASGPPRRVLKVTPLGRRRVRAWLDEPVRHVRDGRSLLLLKLLFLDRAGADPAPLAHAQAEQFGAQLADMEARLPELSGFDATALRWRIGATGAALEFLAGLA